MYTESESLLAEAILILSICSVHEWRPCPWQAARPRTTQPRAADTCTLQQVVVEAFQPEVLNLNLNYYTY